MARKTFPPEVLTPQEVAMLMEACDGAGWTDLRNRALLAVLYRTGLRVSEALALRPKDLDLPSGAIRVLRGKGGRSRTVGIDPGGAEVIGEWLRKREALGVPRVTPMFCSSAGAAITAGYVRRLMASLALRARVGKKVNGLRHTHAAELRAEGTDIGIISRQLGHRSIATTARYLDHIAPVSVLEAIGRRRWK
jgi:integrase/recombinase XerD